jgi:hypothetical protein
MQEQMTCPKEAKGNYQDSGYNAAPEAMVKFGQMNPPSPALAISLFTQDARTQDVPEAMDFLCSNEQEQMYFPKEAKGNSQGSCYITTPDAMVKFGQTTPPSPSIAISLSPQDAKTQDAPEAMVKLSSHQQVQEQITRNFSRVKVQYCARGYGQIWADESSFPGPSHQSLYSSCQKPGCSGSYAQK